MKTTIEREPSPVKKVTIELLPEEAELLYWALKEVPRHEVPPANMLVVNMLMKDLGDIDDYGT